MRSIVLIIDSLVNAGAEATNIRLAKIFKEDGFNVHLISLKNKIDIDIPEGIIFHTIDYKKNDFLFFKNRYYAKKLSTVLNTINNKKLILGSLGLSHRLMNIIDNKFSFYYVIHGNISEAKINKKKGLNKFLKKREIRELYTNKNIITVSNGVKSDINSLDIKVKSIQTIYNPFDFEEIKNKSLEIVPFELPSRYLVHVGRFAKVKRHDILLNAFSKINDKDLKLILIGDGEEKENIKSLIKKLKLEEKVILTGFLKNPYPIIKNAKILVLSSESEGFGNVLIEALILDTLVVSTSTVGAKEIFDLLNIDSLLSNINDITDLKIKIEKAITLNTKNLEINLNSFDKKNILSYYKTLITD